MSLGPIISAPKAVGLKFEEIKVSSKSDLQSTIEEDVVSSVMAQS